MGTDPTNPAAGAPDPGAGGVHDRPLEPDHPMVLEGMTAPGDVRFMAQCMVEDLLISGLAADDLLRARHCGARGIAAIRAF